MRLKSVSASRAPSEILPSVQPFELSRLFEAAHILIRQRTTRVESICVKTLPMASLRLMAVITVRRGTPTMKA